MEFKVPFQIFSVILLVRASSSAECDPSMKGKCYCGTTFFENRNQFIVNCTYTGFTDTTVLEHLPPETEVLIFMGNNISQLPWNIFGTITKYEKLRVVDMSNNQIEEVLGKTYHRVANVKRLILNHNKISITEDQHHSRIFSNFVNLEELHLTNAFQDNSDNLGIDLHDIFRNSNLTKLIKLHLEQNEVARFKDRQVFCDLPKLLDLHLGDNRLTGIDFDINCLYNLRFIDLERNNITRLSKKELEELDSLPQRNQSLKIDLFDNPFSCECGIQDLFDWIGSTKVEVREFSKLRCYRKDGELPNVHPVDAICGDPSDAHVTMIEHAHPVSIVFTILCLVLSILLGILIYTNRTQIRNKFTPMVESVSRKVYYSSIGNNDDQEVDL